MRPTRFFSYTLTGLLACIPVLFPRAAIAEETPDDPPIVVDVDAAGDADEGIDDDAVEKAIAKPKPAKSRIKSKKSAKPKSTVKTGSKSKPKKTAQKKDAKKSKPKVASTKKDGAAPKKVASTKKKPLALSKPSKVEEPSDDTATESVEPKPAKRIHKKPRRPLKRRMKQG